MLLLFDVDGTLTLARQVISKEMAILLLALKKKHILAIVGGSDLQQLQQQFNTDYFSITVFDYVFAENGLDTVLFDKHVSASINDSYRYIDIFIETVQQLFTSWGFIADKYVEVRRGLMNISPIGFDKTIKKRDNFALQDNIHNYRKRAITILRKKFPDLDFVIGGVVSFDAFPKGWDKSYCLRFLFHYTNIHFFGDKMHIDNDGFCGNDYALAISKEVVAHKVNCWQDTYTKLQELN